MAKKDDEPMKGRSNKTDSGKHDRAASHAKRPSRDEQDEGDADYVDVDDPAAAFLDSAVKSTPWWAVSLAFHGLVLACLPLIIFSSRMFKDDTTGSVITRIRPPEVARLTFDGPRGTHNNIERLSDDKTHYEDPLIDFPGAEKSDHNESDSGEDYRKMKGDSELALSYIPGTDGGIGRQPGKGVGVTSLIGVGGGSGGSSRYGGRFGGRKNCVVRGGGGTITEDAVETGLRWLARHQSQDGSWSATNFTAQCKGTTCNGSGTSDFDVGLTGLSVLAFLGAGYTPSNRASYMDPVTGLTMRHGETVRKGLKFLMEKQNKSDGMIGPMVQELMYNHAIAALALCEAYGITNAVTYRDPAQKAVMFVNTAQNYGLGWRYTPHCGNNDTSVTGWCVMVLKSAQISGLDVSQTAFDGAKAWIQRVTDSEGKTGYDKLGSLEVVAAGKNEAWSGHPSMTAVGLLCRIFIDKKKGDNAMAQGARLITADLPKWDPKSQHPSVDYYYWYYATLALFQYDGPDGAQWKKWNNAMKDTLCQNQCVRKDGCADGSWPTEQTDRWGYAGGRVYGTAINVLTLEVYYRYASVFGARDGSKPAVKESQEGK